MKVGLFFGSFNPIHYGHVMIASYMKHFTDLDEVWLVVSPQNPHKKNSDLINAYDRLEMANLAVGHIQGLKVSDIEFSLPKPSYTIDTLTHLEQRYPQNEFILIMGEDNLATLPKWKNYTLLLGRYSIYVYPRFGVADTYEINSDRVVIHAQMPRVEISATFLRKAIGEGKDITGFMPEKVLDFIQKKSLYRRK